MSVSDGSCTKRMRGRKVPNAGNGSDSHFGCSSKSTLIWVSKGILPFSKQVLDDSEKWKITGKLLSWEIWEHWFWLIRARKKRKKEDEQRGR